MKIFENLDINDLDGEIWKVITDFPDYSVSNFGRVKSFIKWHGINKRILKQSKNKDGYFKVNLYKNKKCYTKKIHILLFETFNNYKLKSSECIHHIDENKENNYYNNFRLMTKYEHESFHKKNENIGENNNNSKLKECEVWLIKKILDSDYYQSGNITLTKIGKMFKVHRQTISLIKREKYWSHINFKKI